MAMARILRSADLPAAALAVWGTDHGTVAWILVPDGYSDDTVRWLLADAEEMHGLRQQDPGGKLAGDVPRRERSTAQQDMGTQAGRRCVGG